MELSEEIAQVVSQTHIWQLFASAQLFDKVVRALADPYRQAQATHVIGIEACGFLLGAAVAHQLKLGFIPVRKWQGSFAGELLSIETEANQYGIKERLRVQQDILGPGCRVVLVDDWLETGVAATGVINLVNVCQAEYLGSSVVIDRLSAQRRAELRQSGTLYSLIQEKQIRAWASP